MFTHPVVAGYELNEAELHLMAYWLDGHDPPCRRVTQHPFVEGNLALVVATVGTESRSK